jgi:3-oxoacyl-[acyl-carrier protein] reductase
MKYALITGGSRGIGRAVSLKLAADGFYVFINYKSADQAAIETLNEIRKNGGKGELLKFDVSDAAQTLAALDKLAAEKPDIYIHTLVNNAGIRKDNLLVFMEDSQWHDVLNTNLNSFFTITRALVKNMIYKKAGRIISIVSLSGIKGLPGQTNYSAAKAGIIGATKALAQETARKNVTVNAVAPGFISTDMTADLNESELRKMIPAQRFGKPEEVADLVSFLASDSAAYITGEVIHINGGLYT